MQTYIQLILNLTQEFYIWLFLKLILLLGGLFDYILKVMKSSYDIQKAINYSFTVYYIYYKDKLKRNKSIYNF